MSRASLGSIRHARLGDSPVALVPVEPGLRALIHERRKRARRQVVRLLRLPRERRALFGPNVARRKADQ